MNGLNYFVNAFSKQNFFNFKGRARRAEYAWFALIYYAILATGFILLISSDLLNLGDLGHWIEDITKVFTYVAFCPFIALTARRLHDLGYSGWWQIAIIVIKVISIAYSLTPLGKAETDTDILKVLNSYEFQVGLFLFVIVNLFELAYLVGKDGQKHPNKYGESPKYPTSETEVSTGVVAETETSGEMK